MFCEKCGTQLEEGKSVCPKCGFEPGKNENGSTADAVNAAESMPEAVAADSADAGNIADVSECAVSSSGDAAAVNAVPAAPYAKKKPFFKSLAFIIPVSVVLVCAIAFCIYWFAGKAALKKELLRDWSNTETLSSGSYYMLELDFSDDSVDYNFFSYYIDRTIATFDYKVISPNKISYGPYDRVISVEFDAEKEMMTFTPAMTSTDSKEYWFNFD